MSWHFLVSYIAGKLVSKTQNFECNCKSKVCYIVHGLINLETDEGSIYRLGARTFPFVSL